MTVRMGLLALLGEGPTHGYQLKSGFEARTGGVWKLNVGQVYSTLDRLQADGLVEPVETGEPTGEGRERRPWRIMRLGKDALEAWFDEVAVDDAPPRDEFLVKVLLAFGRSRGEALEVIDRQRTELHRLAGAERRARRADPVAAPGLHEVASTLMAEAVSARREADLRWLDHCESVILTRPHEGAPDA